MPTNPPLPPFKQLATPAELAAPLWARPAATREPAAHFNRATRSTGVPHRVAPAVREHNRGRHFG
jgi:hypothetical protein